jgi:hypothetical protein
VVLRSSYRCGAHERDLAAAGVRVYPARANNFEIMAENEVIVSNGGSSLAAEASLAGREVVHLDDPNIPPLALQQASIAPFPNIVRTGFDNLVPTVTAMRQREPKLFEPTLEPFDVDGAVQAVLAL